MEGKKADEVEKVAAALAGRMNSSAARGKKHMDKSRQRLIAFVFGVVFIIALLVLAIVFPKPTDFQYTVFRIVLALATAGAAAMIPGFIEVEVPGWLRAGGALAVFVVVFFYNPASLVAPTPEQALPKTSWVRPSEIRQRGRVPN